MSNTNVKLLTTAAMVDNLAKKVDKCPLHSIACVQLGLRKLPVIWNSGVPLFRGCSSIEVNECAFPWRMRDWSTHWTRLKLIELALVLSPPSYCTHR